MIEIRETRVPPDFIWKAWNRAHDLDTNLGQPKQQGKFRYRIVNVKKGESFSILWKSLFVRLIFTYKVQPLYSGSQISHQVEVKGPFAWFLRWAIGAKLKENLATSLKSMIQQLEGR